MVPRFHQINGYIKMKVRALRVQKCITLVGADTVLTSAGPVTTPFHWGQYMAQNGNIRNFRPTNLQGTVFAPKQWLYQKEGTGMESSKMYCHSRCRYRTYQYGVANYPVSWGVCIGPRMEICGISGLPILMVPRLHQAMVISKGSYGHEEFKNV